MIFALAILFAAIGDLWGQSQLPAPSGRQTGTPPQTQTTTDRPPFASDTRGTEANPLVVRSIHSKKEAADDATYRNQQSTTEKWNIIIGACAVGGALLQAFIFIVMISTSRRQLRAYVFVETKDDDIPLINGSRGADGKTGTIIPLHVVNRGQTPAYRLHFWITTNVLTDPFPLKTPKPTAETSFTYVDLGPNQPVPMFGILERAWTPAETNLLLTQKAQIYVWGTIFYRDTFSRAPWRRWRRTEFRLMVPVQPGGGVHGIMFCENGNKAT